MQTRDIHSPANLDPAQYDFIEMFDFGPDARWDRWEQESYAEVEDSPYQGNWKTKGSCDHCGVHFTYGAAFRHRPTGECIMVGHICASERLSLPNRAAMRRKQLESRNQGQRHVRRFLEEHPDLTVFESVAEATRTHHILGDMATKLRKYGSLSEKQVAFARRLVAEASGEVQEQPDEPAPSDAQLKFATTLCVERGLDPLTELVGLGRRSISAKIDQLKQQPAKEATTPEPAPDVEAGRYAVADEVTGDWTFYQVDRPTEGRWAGHTFLNHLVGAPGDWARYSVHSRKDSERYSRVMTAIAADPHAAMVAFGRESGICGACGSPLSDPESRARGIGPVCAGKR